MFTTPEHAVSWDAPDFEAPSAHLNYLVLNPPVPTNPLTGRPPNWYYMHWPVNRSIMPIVEDPSFIMAPSSNYVQVPRDGYTTGTHGVNIPDVYTGYLDGLLDIGQPDTFGF